MFKPPGKGLAEAAGSVRHVAVESLVLSGLLLLAAYVLWDTGFTLNVRAPSWIERADGLVLFFIPWQPVLGVSLGLAAYWVLHALGRDRIAFWLIALGTAVPHGPSAWSHNRIGWHELLDLQAELVGDRAVYWDMTLFVVCLVGLIALHRLVGMRGLERWMLSRGVEPVDKRRVMRHERFMLIALLVAGLLLAGLIVVGVAMLARYDDLLAGSPLTIVTLGGGAALLLALTLLLWFRGRQRAYDEEDAVRAGATVGGRSARTR